MVVAPRESGPVRFVGLELTLFVVLCGSLLAVGSVHAWATLLVAGASAGLGCFALWRERLPTRAIVPVATCITLSGFTILQTVPLPRDLLALLSPRALEVWDQSLRPLGKTPQAWLPLSLDPGASWIEAAKWGGYAGLVATTAVLYRQRGGLSRLLLAIVACGFLSAVIALAHRVLDATHLYGLYQPKLAVTPWRVAPLLNPNNFAGYLNFSAFLGLGLLLGRRPPLPPVLLGLALILILAVSVLTGSRGAALSLLCGLIFLVVRLYSIPHVEPSTRGRWMRIAMLSGVVLGAIALAGLGGTRAAMNALLQKDFDKLSIILWVGPLLRDFPGFGIGRGAFETVFPAYRQGGGDLLFQFPENIVAQWLSEWGLLVGSLGLAALGWCLRPRWLELSGDIRRHGAHIGILVLVLHNLVDLSLEISSVATSVFAVLGALVGRAGRRSASELPLPSNIRWWTSGYALAMLGLSGAGYAWGAPGAVHERLELGKAYAGVGKSPTQAASLFERVLQAIRRHPGDPYFPLLAALTINKTGGNALPWLGLAIERDPQRGIPHYWLATLLFQRGLVEQGILHLRLAVSRDPTLRDEAAGPLLEQVKDLKQLMRAIPEGSTGQAFLVTLASRLKGNNHGGITQDALLRAAIARDPAAPRPRLLQAKILADALESPEDNRLCADQKRDDCLLLLDKDVQILSRGPELQLESALVRARQLGILNRHAEADDLLARRCSELQAPERCWRARVDAAMASKDPDRIERSMSAFLGTMCTGASDCAKAATTLGDIFAKNGDWLGALKYYRRAVREHPSKSTWSRLSRAARRANQPRRAQEAELRSHTGLPEIQ